MQGKLEIPPQVPLAPDNNNLTHNRWGQSRGHIFMVYNNNRAQEARVP